jgi:hypothetical protein
MGGDLGSALEDYTRNLNLSPFRRRKSNGEYDTVSHPNLKIYASPYRRGFSSIYPLIHVDSTRTVVISVNLDERSLIISLQRLGQ